MPIRFVADEDFDNRIIRGLLRRQPDLEIIRVQDTEQAGQEDPSILEWAFHVHLVLLTHDVSTMTFHAYERIRSGKSFTGIIVISQSMPIGIAIEDILTISDCSTSEEFENQILYLPL